MIPEHKIRQALLVTLVLAAGTISIPAGAANYALLIGINEYDDRPVRQGVVPLNFAVNDALTLKDILARSGYNVSVLDNTNARHEHILAAFSRLREEIKPEDTFMLFFAGHGLRDPSNGQTYWLTHDTDLDLLDLHGIRLSFLYEYVRDIKARQKVLLLDHCFSGDVIDDPSIVAAAAGSDGSRSGDPDGTRVEKMIDTAQRRGVYTAANITEKLAAQGTGFVVLAAAKAEAYEIASLGHGIFTAALVQALNTHRADANRDGKLSMYELIDFVAGNDGEVAEIANRHNIPQEMSNIVQTRDLGDWVVATLPPEGTEIDLQAEQYTNVLEGWHNRPDGDEWIKVRTLVVAKNAIDRWKTAAANNETLDAKNREIVDKVREYIALINTRGLQEKDIARYFEQAVDNIIDPAGGGDGN